MTNPTAQNWRAIGDTTLAVYEAEFARVASPLTPYPRELWEAARPHSALCLAQMWAEAQYETDRLLLSPADHNPLNLRPGPGMTLATGEKAGFATFDHPADCVIEWKRRISDPAYKGGVYTVTTTLDEYLAVYAPGGDVHPITGVDNADMDYAGIVRTMLTRYAALETPSAEDTDMATHRYVLNMGHRNTDGGGATREQEFTTLVTRKLRDAIQRRGGKAWIIQEEDGDNDTSFCVGRGLQNAARLCVDLANAVGGVDAYISMHYEGATHRIRGVFGIYPDALGLSPASSVDIAANNPLDIQLAKAISKHVGKTGMPVRGDGTMSERASYVGSQGYRLGEMYGSIGFRDTTARVILEAGNYESPEDRALLWSSAWQDKYVNAIVDALEEVFGAFPKPQTQPTPTPTPEPTPAPQYPAAKPIAALADKRPYMITDGKSVLVRADLVVKTTKATPRLMYADANSERIGPDIGAGETFTVDYVVLNPDGSRFWYTPYGTRVKFEDTEIIDAEKLAA